MAGMGFVAIFGAASNTPIACIIMGIELFGVDVQLYIAVTCITAYLFSGHRSIYSSQIIGVSKHSDYESSEGKTIKDSSDDDFDNDKK